jgi:23S rRNA (cytidine2498-2'-O)-methyltransferase
MSEPPPSFVFITCQVGAEPALKHEVAREFPALRFAFSRPGFLTFKLLPNAKLPDYWRDKLVFARAAGFCLGKVTGEKADNRAEYVWRLLGDLPISDLHVWSRDKSSPGYRDYEPGMTVEAAEAERILREKCPAKSIIALAGRGSRRAAIAEQSFVSDPAGQAATISRAPPPALPLAAGGKNSPLVADVVLVTPDEWWVGYHRVRTLVASWPGGFLQAELPESAVSRAWLKMQEAVLWSGFHMEPGQKCIEIGSAPGGASQFLLSQGLHVTGIDPAMMDPAVLGDKHFLHIRKRSKEVPRQEFVGADWLTCDVNLPPNYALDTVKAIVAHPGVRFRGMLLTLKLVDWSLSNDLPKYLARIRSCGFRHVAARHLHHNRQEVCVAASSFRAGKKILPKRRNERPSEVRTRNP